MRRRSLKKPNFLVLRRASVQEQLSRTRWGPMREIQENETVREDRVQRLHSVQEEHKGLGWGNLERREQAGGKSSTQNLA